MKSFSGFCSRVAPEPFLFISYNVGLLLSLFPLNLRLIRESLGRGLLGALSRLVLGPSCLVLLGFQVRASYNPFLVILSFCRFGSSMLKVGGFDV